MRRADKLKARFALILGGDELKKGTVILRNMGDKSQEEIPIGGLIQALKEKIEGD